MRVKICISDTLSSDNDVDRADVYYGIARGKSAKDVGWYDIHVHNHPTVSKINDYFGPWKFNTWSMFKEFGCKLVKIIPLK